MLEHLCIQDGEKVLSEVSTGKVTTYMTKILALTFDLDHTLREKLL